MPSSLLTSELSPDVGAIKWIDANNPSASRWQRVNQPQAQTATTEPIDMPPANTLKAAHVNLERQTKRLLMFGALALFFNALLALTFLPQVSRTNQVMVLAVLGTTIITAIAAHKTLSALKALELIGGIPTNKWT